MKIDSYVFFGSSRNSFIFNPSRFSVNNMKVEKGLLPKWKTSCPGNIYQLDSVINGSIRSEILLSENGAEERNAKHEKNKHLFQCKKKMFFINLRACIQRGNSNYRIKSPIQLTESLLYLGMDLVPQKKSDFWSESKMQEGGHPAMSWAPKSQEKKYTRSEGG